MSALALPPVVPVPFDTIVAVAFVVNVCVQSTPPAGVGLAPEVV